MSAISIGQGHTLSWFPSVTEQSGIRAGDGGFQVNVAGQTDLKGGAITSTQAAIDQNRNSFNANTEEGISRLTTSDLQNRGEFSASSMSASVGTGGGSAGIGQQSGQASSTTQAAISGLAGNQAARTGDKESGITKLFDANEVTREINAQTLITSEFGKQASKAAGDYAATQLKEAIAKQDQEAIDQWKEGGSYRTALHTALGALSGGVGGAAGAALVASNADTLNQLQDRFKNTLIGAGLSEKTATGLANMAFQSGALAAGGLVGGSAGAATALNVDANNRQLHLNEKAAIKRAAADNKQTTEENLTKAACFEVKCWAEHPVGSAERDKNYVSPLEAAGLSAEIAWVKAQKMEGNLFEYGEGAAMLDSFKAGPLQPIKSAVKLVGGGLATATGTGICTTTGVGCIVGGPLAVFGASEAVEGGTALYNQAKGNSPGSFNPVRYGLNQLSPVWGDTAYDATFLVLTIGTLGASVPLKVGASDGINRANSMFGVTVPRWQNPIVNPLTNNVLAPQTVAQGSLLYGVGSKVPAVVGDIKKAGESK